jgi:hypothetical protein
MSKSKQRQQAISDFKDNHSERVYSDDGSSVRWGGIWHEFKGQTCQVPTPKTPDKPSA